MNITFETTYGMTPQEKEAYFKHMEMRHREEQEKIEWEKEQRRAYKARLIDIILQENKRYTKEQLMSKSIRVLEILA